MSFLDLSQSVVKQNQCNPRLLLTHNIKIIIVEIIENCSKSSEVACNNLSLQSAENFESLDSFLLFQWAVQVKK